MKNACIERLSKIFATVAAVLAFVPSIQAQPYGRDTVTANIGKIDSSAVPVPWAVTDGGNTPNLYSPLNLHALYRDQQWETNTDSQEHDFAQRGIWNYPAWFASVGAIESKVDGSASDATRSGNSVTQSFPITYVGLISQGIITKGSQNPGTWLRVLGRRDIAATAFEHGEEERNIAGVKRGPEYALDVLGFRGSENFAGITWQMTGKVDSGSGQDRMDSRRMLIQEDQFWNPTPSVIKNVVAARNVAWIDNAPGTTNPGHVTRAVGARNSLTTNVPKSAFSVIHGVGLEAKMWLAQIMYRLEETDESSKTNRHQIDDWAAMEISSPLYSDDLDVFAKTGVYVEDPNPAGPSGSPLLVPKLAGSNASGTYIEQVASIIARGDAILANIDHKNSTDVVHIKDILHLTPQKDHPSFDPSVGMQDRVGILYFNATRNRLFLSIPFKAEDWTSAAPNSHTFSSTEVTAINNQNPILWIPLDIDLATGSPVLPNGGDLTKIGDGGGSTSTETSKFAPMTVRVQNQNQLVVDGYPTTSGTPTVFWRRKGYGVEQRGKTDWAVLTVTNWGTNPYFDLSTLRAADPNGDGYTPSNFPNGMEVEIILVDPDTQDVAGTTFRI